MQRVPKPRTSQHSSIATVTPAGTQVCCYHETGELMTDRHMNWTKDKLDQRLLHCGRCHTVDSKQRGGGEKAAVTEYQQDNEFLT